MTPPRFVHWAHMSNKFSHFCSRLSLGEKMGGVFFKIARARARGRVRGLRAPKMKAAPLRLRHFACSAQFAYLAHLGAFSARARTGRPPSLSTVERNRQRGSRAARAEVAPWEHREAMWANRFRVHCPNPRNVAGQRRHRRWPTAHSVVTPTPPRNP